MRKRTAKPAPKAEAATTKVPEPAKPRKVAVLNEKYELVDVDSIRQHPKNARKGNLESIDESVTENDFYGALICQKSTRFILVGNHRWLIAKKHGLKKVPVIWVDVDDARATKIALVDNRTSDLGITDDRLLANLLRELSAGGAGFTGTGYSEFDYAQTIKRIGGPDAPSEFVEFNASIDTKHKCPKCSYEFS